MLQTAKCTLQTLKRMLQTAKCTLQTGKRTLQTIKCMLQTTKRMLQTAKRMLQTVKRTLQTTKRTLQTDISQVCSARCSLQTTKRMVQTGTSPPTYALDSVGRAKGRTPRFIKLYSFTLQGGTLNITSLPETPVGGLEGDNYPIKVFRTFLF
jgi:paraquat-inducible protein B